MKILACIHVLFLSLFSTSAFAQNNSLIVNGAYINISNGTAASPAYLIVNQSAYTGIVRNSGGHIISEGEYNFVKWNIANTSTGTFNVPFGYSNTTYLLLSFSKTAGTGTGSFIFSTYRTGTWQNSSFLPAGITNFSHHTIADNSADVIDRFWKIDATGYTTKPDLSSLTFTYADVEHSVASNSITESKLIAQRWNSTSSKWDDFVPSGTINTTSNTFTVPSLSAANLFQWWTLASSDSPLPVELVDFDVHEKEDAIQVTWTTASEINNDHFEIERSIDGINFEKIGEVKGNGTTSQFSTYVFNDEEFPQGVVIYYRIIQVDIDGKSTYSKIETVYVEVDEKSESFAVYPNPLQFGEELTIKPFNISSNANEEIILKIYNAVGEEVYKLNQILDPSGITIYEPLNTFNAGVYSLKLFYNAKSYYFKVVKL